MFLTREKRISLRYALAIVGIGFIAVLPAILFGAFDAMDLSFHLKWSKHFAEQFWMGDLYPRWLQHMNLGLGSPAFFFYAPVPYYFTSLLHPLFAHASQSWQQLSGSLAIALIASGFTAFVWLRSMTDRNAALIGSILYMVLPYHLAVNLYWRFAFAEYWALAWLPLILYFSRRLIHYSRAAFVGVAISYALLIMTHLPTLVMFSPLPIFYVLAIADRDRRLKSLIRLIAAMTLGIGIAAIYWLPAMTTQAAISMTAILEKGYLYSNNFLFSQQAALYHNKNLWLYLEFLAVLMLGVAVSSFALTRKTLPAPLKRENKFWFLSAIVTFLMMLPISQPVWQVLPPLQRIQFPWRFNTLLLVAVTALLTLAVYCLKQSLTAQKKTIVAIGLLLTVSLLLSNGVVIKQRLKPRPNYDVANALAMSIEEALEYRPKSVAPAQFQADAMSNIAERFSQGWEAQGPGSVTIQAWQPRKVVLESTSTVDRWLTLKQFYYPGWTARLNTAQLLPMQATDPEGLIRFKVPSGNHQVQVTLDAGLQERMGQIVSAIALLIAGWLRFPFVGFHSRNLRSLESQPQQAETMSAPER